MRPTHDIPTRMFGPTGLSDRNGDSIGCGDTVAVGDVEFVVGSALGFRLYGVDADGNPRTALARLVEKKGV